MRINLNQSLAMPERSTLHQRAAREALELRAADNRVGRTPRHACPGCGAAAGRACTARCQARA